jgi:hypothetical protein
MAKATRKSPFDHAYNAVATRLTQEHFPTGGWAIVDKVTGEVVSNHGPGTFRSVRRYWHEAIMTLMAKVNPEALAAERLAEQKRGEEILKQGGRLRQAIFPMGV